MWRPLPDTTNSVNRSHTTFTQGGSLLWRPLTGTTGSINRSHVLLLCTQNASLLLRHLPDTTDSVKQSHTTHSNIIFNMTKFTLRKKKVYPEWIIAVATSALYHWDCQHVSHTACTQGGCGDYPIPPGLSTCLTHSVYPGWLLRPLTDNVVTFAHILFQGCYHYM